MPPSRPSHYVGHCRPDPDLDRNRGRLRFLILVRREPVDRYDQRQAILRGVLHVLEIGNLLQCAEVVSASLSFELRRDG